VTERSPVCDAVYRWRAHVDIFLARGHALATLPDLEAGISLTALAPDFPAIRDLALRGIALVYLPAEERYQFPRERRGLYHTQAKVIGVHLSSARWNEVWL
jgi:hypothetical protein